MQSITSLYKEKKKRNSTRESTTSEKKVEKKKKPKEKIKKNIYDYEKINGIKIYNSILPEEEKKITEIINIYKDLNEESFLTPLELSTLNTQGSISNIDFNEETFMFDIIHPGEINNIVKIGCNYGELYNFPNPYILPNNISPI